MNYLILRIIILTLFHVNTVTASSSDTPNHWLSLSFPLTSTQINQSHTKILMGYGIHYSFAQNFFETQNFFGPLGYSFGLGVNLNRYHNSSEQVSLATAQLPLCLTYKLFNRHFEIFSGIQLRTNFSPLLTSDYPSGGNSSFSTLSSIGVRSFSNDTIIGARFIFGPLSKNTYISSDVVWSSSLESEAINPDINYSLNTLSLRLSLGF